MKIIGIDGGGTKTKFVLYSINGEKLNECTLPSCHILQTDDETSQKTLRQGIESLVNPQDEVLIVAGLAGYGQNPHYRQRIEHNCQCAFDYPYLIYNDVEIAMEAALNSHDGIVVISGTGSIAFCKCNGVTYRCGGWGYALGDEGSGYWIAKKMLAAFCKQADGRENKTYLYDLVMEHCHLKTDYEIIAYVNDTLHQNRDQIASLAPLVYQAACANDPVAMDIYQQAADEIASLIRTLQKNFENEVEVSYIGGVFNVGNILIDPILKQLENVNLHAPIFPAEYGAYLLGKKHLK